MITDSIEFFSNPSLLQPFRPTALRRRHGQTVRDSTSSYKIDYVIVIKNSRNPKGHQNPISGSKVTAILLKQWILPIGGREGSAPAACAAGLFLSPVPQSLIKVKAIWTMSKLKLLSLLRDFPRTA